MQKIYCRLGWVLAFGCLLAFANISSGQTLRNSIFQYHFNQQILNPAYVATPYQGLEANYFGNFTTEGQVSRSGLVTYQSPAVNGGVGASLQFYRTSFFGELNFRPAYAYRLFLPNDGEISFGANVGLSYFDQEESVLTNIQSDFFSFDGGMGVFYHKERFFAGISILKLFEFEFGYTDAGNSTSLLRDNPFSFHAGWAFHLMDDVELMPRALLQYINIYELPKGSSGSIGQDYSYDFQLSAYIEDMYVVSLIYGETEEEFGSGLRRVGLSASYIVGNFRLSYAIQLNSRINNSVSLPASHLVGVGFDFYREDESKVRYF